MHGRTYAGGRGHRAGGSYGGSISAGQKAQLTNAYQELGRELSSTQIKTVGNYTLGRVIGEGSFGKVRLAVNKLTSHRCAIKQIPRTSAPPLLTREIHHHRRLHHPHVLRLFEVIATEGNIWLVSELCAGGELFDYLVERGRLGENECKRMFGQLCYGVGYIHQQGVVHRDLKLENVLLDEKLNVKIADFGFGREFEQRRLMETFCGTTGYAAPEMLAGKKYLGEEVDVWSLGIILYTLLTGSLPFDDDDEEEMKRKIQIGKYDLPTWLSEDSRNLISGILKLEPRERLSITQILGHDWFTKPTVASPNPGGDYFSTFDSLPEVIPEETNSSPNLGDTHGQPSSSDPSPEGSSNEHGHDPSTAASEASSSSWRSATSESDAGLGGRRAETPLTADEEETHHFLATSSKGKEPHREFTSSPEPMATTRIPRNASQTTITNSDSLLSIHHQHMSRQSSTLSRSDSASPNSSWRFPPPSPSMLDGMPHGSPALPIPAHSRTPSRTKRRSVGSTISERMLRNDEGPSLPDFLALLAAPTAAPFTTNLEKQLLESLGLLGFDTGQMIHSVKNDACDASGAIWWMLKLKAEAKEAELQELSALAQIKSSSSSSLAPSYRQPFTPQAGRTIPQAHGDADGHESDSGSMKAAERKILGELENTKHVQIIEVQPTPPPVLDNPMANEAPPGAMHVQVLEYGGPEHTPSPRKPRLSGRMSSISAPALSLAQAEGSALSTPKTDKDGMFGSGDADPRNSPTSTLKEFSPVATKDASPAAKRQQTKPRSASVSTINMLQRATSALGVTKRDKAEDVPTPSSSAPAETGDGGRSTPNLLSGGLFGRKASGSEASRPPLGHMSSSKERLQNALSRSGTGSTDSVPPEGSSASSQPSSEARSRTTTSNDPKTTPPMMTSPLRAPGLLAVPKDSPGGWSTISGETMEGANYLDKSPNSRLRDSAMSGSSTSTLGSSTNSGKAARGSKNLFSSFKMWFNDDKRKQKRHRQSSAPSHDYTFGSPRSLSGSQGSLRRPAVQAPSPLQRPPMARVPSSTSSVAVSRRNSSTSARRMVLGEGASPVLTHTRRRSDASRHSLSSMNGSRTPLSEHHPERENSRPPSSLSGAPVSGDVYAGHRKRHARGSSTSSTGSRSSTMISGSPVAAYRRTPAVTQVRRLSGTPTNGRNRNSLVLAQSRNGSSSADEGNNPGSGTPRRSSFADVQQSLSTGGSEGETTIMEEENEGEQAEEATGDVESERDRALRKLSGESETSTIASEGRDTSLYQNATRKPSNERRSSSESTRRRGASHHRHGSASSISSSQHPLHHHQHSVFTAHKVVNPFGTPHGSHYQSNNGKDNHSGRHSSSSHAANRPKLRDVFASKGAEGEDGWVDEDEELGGYSGGFGQSTSKTSAYSAASVNGGARGLGLSTAGSSGELQSGDSPMPERIASNIFGEGRYAGLTRGGGGDCSAPGLLGNRQSMRASGGAGGSHAAKQPAFKRAAIVEEEEEEEG